MDKFSIKDSYTEQEKVVNDEDAEKSLFQADVYRLANKLYKASNANMLVDIGCGKAYKLINLCDTDFTVGIDLSLNIDWCESKWPEREWLCLNLENVSSKDVPIELIKDSVIVCSDVVEHLDDPDNLINTLHEWNRYAKTIIISTPERELTYGCDHSGPPGNKAHKREWNFLEFHTYLHKMGLTTTFYGLTTVHAGEVALKWWRTIIAVVE